ncbi:glycosyltransferase [Nitrospina gracilis]|uniref:glycosyltransferase n=1 Tax=Nitrospina gracilis TaxID=35801 RepID=UPI001F3D57ED|nr:glycosyltransferase [Nitrospina gracilis]MCF8719444.1 glycosyltransferase involved in cell wall biosynthesis [Nitrospina gracilis Nb-211]
MNKIKIKLKRTLMPENPEITSIDEDKLNSSEYLKEIKATTIDSLDDYECAVILGPPGIGKTVLLKEEQIKREGEGKITVFIPINQISSKDTLNEIFKEEYEIEKINDPSNEVYLFFDGLDESRIDINELTSAIIRKIKNIKEVREKSKAQKIYIRISCRSEEWPKEFEQKLKGMLGEREVRQFYLLPLNDYEIKSAIASNFKEQKDKYEEIIEVFRLHGFARRPITLQMLLRIFRNREELPSGQAELFKRGILAALEESSGTRRKIGKTGLLDVEERNLIAGRIATLTILSNRNYIWAGLYSENFPDKSLAISEICGGKEVYLNKEIVVNEAAVREVLNTELFYSIKTDLYQWSHLSFAEYLAAYYLVVNGLSDLKILSLVSFVNDEKIQIPPQTREVVRWLAVFKSSFCKRIIEIDPEILLASDVASLPYDIKELLLNELLKKFDKEEIHDFWQDKRVRYEELIHPGITEQLKPYIQNLQRGIIVRRVAINIAEACGLQELGGEILKIAKNQKDNHLIRKEAISAIRKLDISSYKEELKDILSSGIGDDPMDQIKGELITSLWPKYLNKKELFNNLIVPKAKNFLGSYRYFLHKINFEKWAEEDVLEGLKWLEYAIKNKRADYDFQNVIRQVLFGAWEFVEAPRVLEKMAVVFVHIIREHKYHIAPLADLSPLYEKSELEIRRAFVIKILEKFSEEGISPGWINLWPWKLVFDVDRAWLVEELKNKRESIKEKYFIELLINLIRDKKPDDIPEVIDLAKKNQELNSILEGLYVINLDSEHARWLREEYQHNKNVATEEERPSLRQVINTLIKECEQDSFNWWRLNLALLDSEEPGNGLDEFESNLLESSGWIKSSDKEKAKIIEVAKNYLIENEIEFSKCFEKNTVHRPAQAGYRAFRLLFGQDKDRYYSLKEPIWETWTPAIVGFVTNFKNDEEREIFSKITGDAYKKAPEKFLASLKSVIENENYTKLKEIVKYCYDQKIANVLLSKVMKGVKGENEYELLVEILLEKGNLGIIDKIKTEFYELITAEGITVSENEKNKIIGPARLIQFNPEIGLPLFWQVAQKNNQKAKEIWKMVSTGFRLWGNYDFVSKINSNQLADIYIWADEKFEEDVKKQNNDGEAHFVTSEENVLSLNKTIIDKLVNDGTYDGILALEKISQKLPEKKWLKWSVKEARQNHNKNVWFWFSPKEILTLIFGEVPQYRQISTKESIISYYEEMENDKQYDPQDDRLTVPKTQKEGLEKERISQGIPVSSLKILAVADEWFPRQGGISRLNKDICCSLSALGHGVTCIVLDPTEDEIADAESNNVNLIGAPKNIGVEGINRLLLFQKDDFGGLSPEVIFGHGPKLGPGANHIAGTFFPDSKFCYFVHTLPKEIEIYKNHNEDSDKYKEGIERDERQMELCKKADFVVPIGPRIGYNLKSHVDTNKIFQLCPGLNKEFMNLTHNDPWDRIPIILIIGRMGDDPTLKGLDYALHILKKVHDKELYRKPYKPKLRIRGLDPNLKFDSFGIKDSTIKQYFEPLPYEEEIGKILKDFQSSSILIMPSRSEGFGLVGLEAISAGIPVLVSDESGLGMMLITMDIEGQLPPGMGKKCVVSVSGNDDEVTDRWAKAINEVLSDLGSAYKNADNFRKSLSPHLVWSKIARDFSEFIQKSLQGYT